MQAIKYSSTWSVLRNIFAFRMWIFHVCWLCDWAEGTTCPEELCEKSKSLKERRSAWQILKIRIVLSRAEPVKTRCWKMSAFFFLLPESSDWTIFIRCERNAEWFACTLPFTNSFETHRKNTENKHWFISHADIHWWLMRLLSVLVVVPAQSNQKVRLVLLVLGEDHDGQIWIIVYD